MMRKLVVIFIAAILIFFIAGSFYRASQLHNIIDELSAMDFESIEILEYNGIEHSYKNGTEEFETIKTNLFELLGKIYPTDYVIKRGETKDGVDIIVYLKDGTFYKLYFGYAPSVNTINVAIFDKRNFSIDRHYHLENEDAMKFLKIKQYLKVQSEVSTN